MKTLSHIITTPLLVLATLAPAQTPAQSHTVYRCGNSYSPQPCEGGPAINAADERSAEQRKSHDSTIRRDVRTADAMEKERLKQEAAAARAAEHAARAEQQAARRNTPPTPAHKAKNQHAQDKLPAYRAPTTPKPATQ